MIASSKTKFFLFFSSSEEPFASARHLPSFVRRVWFQPGDLLVIRRSLVTVHSTRRETRLYRTVFWRQRFAPLLGFLCFAVLVANGRFMYLLSYKLSKTNLVFPQFLLGRAASALSHHSQPQLTVTTHPRGPHRVRS